VFYVAIEQALRFRIFGGMPNFAASASAISGSSPLSSPRGTELSAMSEMLPFAQQQVEPRNSMPKTPKKKRFWQCSVL
jgi:hypothetical protein